MIKKKKICGVFFHKAVPSFVLFNVLQNTHHKKEKDGTNFVDPSPYTINLLIAYDENT